MKEINQAKFTLPSSFNLLVPCSVFDAQYFTSPFLVPCSILYWYTWYDVLKNLWLGV